MSRYQTILRPFWRTTAIGLAVGVLVTALYATGWTARLEAWSLDFRFQHTNRFLSESDRIRVVAIDDQSLRQIGRWPWPRRHLADLVNILHEVGAERIALDLHFAEPQLVREAEAEPPLLPGVASPVDDDSAFAAAVRDAGNVYLPVVCDLIPGRYDLRTARHKAAELAQKAEPLGEQEFARRVGLPEWLLGPDAYLRSRMALLLRERLWLSEEDLASLLETDVQALKADVQAVRNWIGAVKRQVALELVEGCFEADPRATLEAVSRSILPDRASMLDPPPEIHWAHEQARSRRAVHQHLPAATAQSFHLLQTRNPYDVQVPIPPLAEAAAGFGHVVVLREGPLSEPDGAVRRLPMLIEWRDRLVPQLALRLAADLRNLDLTRAAVASDRIQIPVRTRSDSPEQPPLVLSLDPDGQTLLNWVRAGRGWTDSFGGLVPAGLLLEIPELRRRIQRNEEWCQVRLLRLVQLIQPTELARYERLLDFCRRHRAAKAEGSDPAMGSDPLTSSRGLPPSPDQAGTPATTRAWHPRDAEQLAAARDEVRRIESVCVELLRQAGKDLPAAIAQTADPTQRAELQELQTLHEQLAEGLLRSQIDETNAKLRARLDAQLAYLRERLAGRICLVGYTASALADFVGTPIWPNAPGVLTHAQLLNALLQGRLIRPLDRAANTGAVLLACLLVTLLTAWRGPRSSLPAMLGAGALFAGFNALVLFERFSVAMALATPLVGMFITWAMITAYRELVEERAKRHIARTLQQYTSPALARRMAEDPTVVAKAEHREVTCYFSDLYGFTGISERLGAEQTQQVLNVYLERMTEVLDGHEALVNKFIGDAVFAFFNPAIHPQPDHARRACRAAIDTLAALETLRRQATGDPVVQALRMRIGLASGMAVVGNCGSERKFDYTCIGDTVNVANRLEAANKTLGTRILLNARCHDLLDEQFVCRRIGRLLVAGRAAFEETYELIGRPEDVDGPTREGIGCFETAIDCFIAGKLRQSLSSLEECLRRWPDDLAAKFYLDLCRHHLQAGPGENWTGAIEIVGK